MKAIKAIKETWFFLCLMVALALAFSGKANSGINDSRCGPVDYVTQSMAVAQYERVKVEFFPRFLIVTYKRSDDMQQYVFLPSGRACLINPMMWSS